MGKYIVKTSTGSLYLIDTEEGVWGKNVEHPHEKLERVAVGVWNGLYRDVPDVGAWEDREIPEVGLNMYIKGRGRYNWYVTTPIVSVEEVEAWRT